MVDDPDVAARVALWASVPDTLHATGMTAAGLTRQVLASADPASSRSAPRTPARSNR